MSENLLYLIGPTPPIPGGGFVREVLQCWYGPDCPTVTSLTIDGVLDDPTLLKDCAVAWVILDAPQVDRLYDLIAHLQDVHVMGMLTRPQETNPIGGPFLEGVVTAPPQAQPSAVAAMLRTLWSQAAVLKALKIEMSILKLHNEGVISEFGKLDEEMRLAAQLQRDLLPAHLPRQSGIEFTVLFRPARYVSGDIYDVNQFDENHIGFFIADAMGHGVSAALMTVYIKSVLAVCEKEPIGGIFEPNEALTRLNRALVHYECDQVRTATAVYGVINTKTREVRIARGGHPYPMVLRADGTTLHVGPDGPILGVFADTEFEMMSIQLEPGDRLLFYSDGFELAFPEIVRSKTTQRSVANQKYLDAFKDLAHGPVDEAIEGLAEQLDQQVGSLNQTDDLTAILVGINPIEHEPRD